MQQSKLLRESSHSRYSKRRNNSVLEGFELDIELKKLNLQREYELYNTASAPVKTIENNKIKLKFDDT